MYDDFTIIVIRSMGRKDTHTHTHEHKTWDDIIQGLRGGAA